MLASADLRRSGRGGESSGRDEGSAVHRERRQRQLLLDRDPMRLIADDSPAVVLPAERGSAKSGGGVVAATAILAIGIAVRGMQEEAVSRWTIFERSLRPDSPSLPASRRLTALPRGNP